MSFDQLISRAWLLSTRDFRFAQSHVDKALYIIPFVKIYYHRENLA